MNRQKTMNNKGFSLVELIIVIAIMAVLVGVLAPAYLSYVEKSKKNTDVSTVDGAMGAMKTLALDPEFVFNENDTMTYVVTTTGQTFTAAVDPSTNNAIQDAFEKIIPKSNLKSSNWGTITIVGKVGADGELTFTASNSEAGTVFKTFAKQLKFES